jgi:hypothetical protein
MVGMGRAPSLVAVLAAVAASGAVAVLAPACGAERTTAEQRIADASADHVAAAPSVVAADAAVAIVDAGVDAVVADAGPGVCNVRLEAPPLMDSPHVPEGTAVAYGSNPPSSGPHYPVWANFQEFTHPVDDGYLVHSMEHGAVLLLYKCGDDAGACDAMVAALRAVRDAVPTDPSCDPAIRVRIILAPRAANDVPIAAAAWGHVYRADCVDAPSLARFISDHYAMASENLCVAGSVY